MGPTQAEEGPMTVFVYVNTSKQIGDKDHVKVFANVDAAENWFGLAVGTRGLMAALDSRV